MPLQLCCRPRVPSPGYIYYPSLTIEKEIPPPQACLDSAFLPAICTSRWES